MKKRKTYEISVIDKTYSKTLSDETKFYTSDTALELGFELKETEYDFKSAEIVLLNVDDRSLVTRPVTKILDSFAYELDDDITDHYGEWRGQLRFEQGEEIYVSSPVKFRIENDLSNERPPQLSDVQSWVSLKRYADSLTEELKQAVLSIEGVEDTFNANEQSRQSQFESNEQSRQTIFETNESGRDETFSTNETTRQSQELEREKAEATRQTVFDDNEVNRTETFNVNEVTRQENEEARELAENERENAEAQRKIDHANRSAELAGKADKQQEGWIIPTLLNGWEVQSTGQTPRYYKDEFGIVHMEGCVKSGLDGSNLFVLPTGYKAIVTKRYAASNSDTTVGRVDVLAGGAVSPHKGSSFYVYLSGISFRAEG